MNKQDYYVYVHRRLDNNQIFYVGSGRANRHISKDSRSKQWLDTVESYGYTSEILTGSLSQQEARELEALTIDMLPCLVNQRKPTEAHDLNKYLDELMSMFYVDDNSPTGLTYKVNRFKNKGATSKLAGSPAGNVKYLPNGNPRGYRLKLTFKDKSKIEIPVHRIVYLLAHGKIDTELVIDHIDGNPLNNSVLNLRLVSQEVNSRNKSPKESSVLQGVVLKDGAWRCNTTEGNKRSHASFSINKYGNDLAFEMALNKRKEFLMQLKEKGIEYSERHLGFRLE